ncbi:MAG: type VI secretion system contractile sheath small subunit [Desulfobacteraceae bacterium]|nr:type VI secretion system contractile sheath small subunit [Desulfobacteraceae bacterium]
MAVQDEIPKSRLTLRYKTEVNGQPEDLALPMRFLVTGDFSQGSSKDRKIDLDERNTRNMDGKNTNAIMKDMGISLNYSVDNKINPDQGEEELQVNLPFDSMKSFSPDQVAKNVPRIKGLLMLKELLQEVVSNVDNRKGYRKLLGELMGNEEALKKMMEELKDFESFKLPGAKSGE